MSDITVKEIKVYLINFTPVLALNKHTFALLYFKHLYKNRVALKLNLKVKNTRITTLRAPKHFKVGRHHYQIERNGAIITFKMLNSCSVQLPTEYIPHYAKAFGVFFKKLGYARAFSIVASTRVTFSVSRQITII